MCRKISCTNLRATLVFGLIVLIITSEFALRDRRDHIEETLATVFVESIAFALAKYLVALGAALLLAVVFLAIQLCVELIGYLIHSPDYPTLRRGPYIRLWLLLLLPAVCFASAVSLCGTFVFGNRRLALFLVFFVLWLAPFFAGNSISFADITGNGYYVNSVQPFYGAIEHAYVNRAIELNGETPPDPSHPPAPGSIVFSLNEVRPQLVQALNSWPSDLDQLVHTQLLYGGAAIAFILLALWRFRRFQPDGARA